MSTDEELAEAMDEVDAIVRRHDDIHDPVPATTREPVARRLRSLAAEHDMILTMLGAGAVGLLAPLGLPIWAVAVTAVGIGWSLAHWAGRVRSGRRPTPMVKPRHPPRGSLAVPSKQACGQSHTEPGGQSVKSLILLVNTAKQASVDAFSEDGIRRG